MQSRSRAPTFGSVGQESFWAVVQTKPSAEEKARDGLKETLKAETCLPLVRRRAFLRGKKIIKTRPLFPGYVFARSRSWFRYQEIGGVVKLVMSGSDPARLPDDVLTEIRGRMDDEDVVDVSRFARGQKVYAVRGPFWQITGVFDGCVKQDRVRVLYDLLGVQTPVELSETDILAV